MSNNSVDTDKSVVNNVRNDIMYLGTMGNDGGIVDTHVQITKTHDNYSDLDQPKTATITVESLNQTREEVGMSEYGFPMVKYISVMKNHSITLELDLNARQALINDLDIQSCFPGELTLLLKHVESELNKINITRIVQQIMFEDWINILQPLNIFELQYHNKEHGFATVMCRTDQCAEAIMKGLGF